MVVDVAADDHGQNWKPSLSCDSCTSWLCVVTSSRVECASWLSPVDVGRERPPAVGRRVGPLERGHSAWGSGSAALRRLELQSAGGREDKEGARKREREGEREKRRAAGRAWNYESPRVDM